MITKYLFTLPKKNNTSAFNNKNILADKILNAYPWLGKKKEDKEIFDYYYLDTISCPAGTKCPFNISDLEDEFFKFMSALSVTAKDYDFEDEFGTPIRIFDNFVQIGYDVIPITPGSLNHLKPKTKKTIIDITIKLKNSGLF